MRGGAVWSWCAVAALVSHGVSCGARVAADSENSGSENSGSEKGAPSKSSARPLSERLSRRSDDLPLQSLPQGVVRLRLQGRFGHAALLQREDDNVSHRCVDSVDALPRWQSP